MAPPTRPQVSSRLTQENMLQHWRNRKDRVISEIEHIKNDFGNFWDLDDELDHLASLGKKTAEILDFYLENKGCLTGDQIRSLLDFYEKCLVDSRTVECQMKVESEGSVTEGKDVHSDSVSSEKPKVYSAIAADGSSESSANKSLPSDYKGSISSKICSRSDISSSLVRSSPYVSLTNVVSSLGEDEIWSTCDCLYQQYYQEIEGGSTMETETRDAATEIGGDTATEISATAMEEIGATAMEEIGATAMEEIGATAMEESEYFVFNNHPVYDKDVAAWLKENMSEFTVEEMLEAPTLLSFMKRIKKRDPQYHLIQLSEKLIWKMKKDAYKREMILREKWLKGCKDSNDEVKLQKEQKKLEQMEKKLLKEQKKREDRKQKKDLEEDKKRQRKQKQKEKKEKEKEKEKKEKREEEKRILFSEKLPRKELNKTEVEDMLLRCGSTTLSAQLDEIKCLCQIIREANANLFHTEGLVREINESQYADRQSKESMLLRKCAVIDPEVLKRQTFIHILIKAIDICASSDDAENTRMAQELIDILKRPKQVPKFLVLKRDPDGTISLQQKRKGQHAVHRGVEATPSSDTLAGAEEIREDIQCPVTECFKIQDKAGADSLNLSVAIGQEGSSTSVLSPMEECLDATDLKYMDDPSTCSMDESNSE